VKCDCGLVHGYKIHGGTHNLGYNGKSHFWSLLESICRVHVRRFFRACHLHHTPLSPLRHTHLSPLHTVGLIIPIVSGIDTFARSVYKELILFQYWTGYNIYAAYTLIVQEELVGRHEASVEIARQFLTLMEKTYSPLKKLENILGAVSAINTAVSSG